MPPLVSILIPAYNAEKWIADTIASALAQTWPNKEIIIVDDGSKDQTLTVARQFASSSVTVVAQPNQGAAAARNKAFELCRGDYIQWLDADDLLSPDKIARQMEAAASQQNPRTLLSCPWGYFMYRPSRAVFSSTPLCCDLSPVEFLVRKMGQNLHMQTSTWLVSRELSQAAGPWDTRLSLDDDGEYFCRVLLASEGTRFVPEAKVFYRMAGSASLSTVDKSNKKLESQFLSMRLHIRYLRSLEESPRTHAACVNYLQTWFHYFYPKRADIMAQAQALAQELGGQLAVPSLPWKYAWIHRLFGWDAAKRVQVSYNQSKSSAIRAWDKLMYSLEGRKLSTQSASRGT